MYRVLIENPNPMRFQTDYIFSVCIVYYLFEYVTQNPNCKLNCRCGRIQFMQHFVEFRFGF